MGRRSAFKLDFGVSLPERSLTRHFVCSEPHFPAPKNGHDNNPSEKRHTPHQILTVLLCGVLGNSPDRLPQDPSLPNEAGRAWQPADSLTPNDPGLGLLNCKGRVSLEDQRQDCWQSGAAGQAQPQRKCSALWGETHILHHTGLLN